MLQLIQSEIKNDPYYQQNFANDGERFVAWYLRRVLLRDSIQARDDITDGQNDKQMDAVIIDDDDRRVLIVQGKFLTSTLVDADPLREVLSAWLRLHDLHALQQDANEKLKKKIEAIRTALDDEYRVDFELLSTGILTDAAKADLKVFAEKLEDFDEMSASLQLVDTEVLETRLAEAEAQELPTIDHVIKVDSQQTLATQVGNAKTILTVLPLTECLRLLGIIDGRLFRKNVRQAWGAQNRVNRALRTTINGERVREFFYYHNGITAICDVAQYDEAKGTISVKGLSVVNGCQSISTIYTVSERVRSPEAKDARI
jgi:AIPR protein